MSTARTVGFAIGGGILYLMTSIGRAQRGSDCTALADGLAGDLHAIDTEVQAYSPDDIEKNRRGLQEVAASLQQLSVKLGNMSIGTTEIRERRAKIAEQLNNMQAAIAAISAAIASEKAEAAQRGAKDYADSRDLLRTLLADAEHACIE